AGEARGDEQELGVVARGQQDVVARDDRDARGRVVAGVVGRPGAEAGVRVRLEDGHAERARDADRATARAGDDRDDGVGRLRGDRHVLHRVDVRGVVDVRVGVQRDQVDTHTHTDTGGTGDRERRGDAELVQLVTGGDVDGLVRVRATDVRRARQPAVDLSRRANVRGRVGGDDVDNAGEVDRGGAGEARTHADRREVVAVRGGDADAAERGRARGDRARTHLARVAGGLRARLHDAVRPAAAVAT